MEDNAETFGVCRDLPRIVILDRKYGVRKFTSEDLDRVCKYYYGEKCARCDAEKDRCIVTFEKLKPEPIEVALFKMGDY